MVCLKTKQLFFLFVICFFSWTVHANVDIESEADSTIVQLYHTLAAIPKSEMSERLDVISQQFLNKPYLLGALGEGRQGKFDQFPLYRTDAFDCETFVDTVLAVALAKDQTGFKQCINQIRYRHGQVSFLARNHFTDLDWNRNNQQQGFVKDITKQLHDQQNQPIFKNATAQINKPSWYQHFTLENIRLLNNNPDERSKRLTLLKQRGSQLETVVSTIPYIPLTALFDKDGKKNIFLLKQIPDGAIIEIVRPNWNLKDEIGTNLNVSHLGFGFWRKDVLMFSEASSTHQRTIEIPLAEYLQKFLQSPTIKGINVHAVVPTTALEAGCKKGTAAEKLKEN
jgi:hypothetical protein